MRKKDILLALFVCVVLLGVGAHRFITYRAGQALDTTLASIETPEQVELYAGLAEDNPQAARGTSPIGFSGAEITVRPCGSLRDVMRSWEGLFKEAPRWIADANVPEKTESARDSVSLPDAPDSISEARAGFLNRVRVLASCGGPLFQLRFPEVYRESPPHWVAVRDIAELLLTESVRAAKEHDGSRVVANLLAAMQLADGLAFEPLLQAQHIRYELYRLVRETYLEICEEGLLPPDALAGLLAHLAQAYHREGLRAAIAGELHRTTYAFDAWRTEGFIEMANSANFVVATRRRIWRSALCEPFFWDDERTAVEAMKKIVAIPDGPFFDVKRDMESVLEEIDALPVSSDYAKSVIIQFLEDSFSDQALHEINIDLWRLRVLVDRFHEETGDLPQSLEIAASRFGERPPYDPSNGRSYRYVREADCYVLSSAGVWMVGGHEYSLGRHAWLCPN